MLRIVLFATIFVTVVKAIPAVSESPVGAKERSPGREPWVWMDLNDQSPVRGDRISPASWSVDGFLSPLPGLEFGSIHVFPGLAPWATLFRPSGAFALLMSPVGTVNIAAARTFLFRCVTM